MNNGEYSCNNPILLHMEEPGSVNIMCTADWNDMST